MQAQPVATIVITTCDRPGIVDRAVSSALAQTETRIEVLVVDDGTRVPYRVQRADDRLGILRTHGREGANRARNTGLMHARGEWISFLDDDDELLPSMVAVSLTAAAASPLPAPVAVLSAMAEVAAEGSVVRTLVPGSLVKGSDYSFSEPDPVLRAGLAAHNTLFAPVALLRELGGFDEQFTAYMHDDLLLRVNRVASLQGSSAVTYRLHHHPQSRLSRNHGARARGMARLHDKHRALFARHPRRAARHLALTSWTFLRAGDWVPAVRYSMQSLLADPGRPRAVRQLFLAIAGPRVAVFLKRLQGQQT